MTMDEEIKVNRGRDKFDETAEDDTNNTNLVGEEALARDYANIALLMKELDSALKCFTINMNGIVDSAVPHDTLSALWEAHTKANSSSRLSVTISKQANNQNSQNDEQCILGEEAEDPDDPLIFL